MTEVRERPASTNFLIASFGYDSIGRRSSLTRGNGLTTSYGYDAVSRLTSLAHDASGARMTWRSSSATIRRTRSSRRRGATPSTATRRPPT